MQFFTHLVDFFIEIYTSKRVKHALEKNECFLEAKYTELNQKIAMAINFSDHKPHSWEFFPCRQRNSSW